jgi:hypothetical protein
VYAPALMWLGLTHLNLFGQGWSLASAKGL